jgi:hypothetical protein
MCQCSYNYLVKTSKQNIELNLKMKFFSCQKTNSEQTFSLELSQGGKIQKLCLFKNGLRTFLKGWTLLNVKVNRWKHFVLVKHKTQKWVFGGFPKKKSELYDFIDLLSHWRMLTPFFFYSYFSCGVKQRVRGALGAGGSWGPLDALYFQYT